VLPPGVTIDQVMSSPSCYVGERTAATFYCDGKVAPEKGLDLTAFNKAEFLRAVESMVIEPMQKTAKLFADQAYVTRLYTTMSAGEMTLDPTFDINDELESQNVSNQHTVTMRYPKSCPGDTSGDWEADFGDFIVRGTGNTWPVKTATTKLPFNRRVTQLAARGQAQVLTNNNALIAAALGGAQPAPGSTPDGGATVTPPRADVKGGCSVTPGADASAPAWLLLGIPALLVLRRRRPRG
jgi:MYXO-CTERM domain-containing protein